MHILRQSGVVVHSTRVQRIIQILQRGSHFDNLLKYDALVVETDTSLSQAWSAKTEKSTDCGKPVFTMLMPPPNVTGTLHLGHAYTLSVQDILARWRRMCGDEVKWTPGLDHAGIATQTVVERYLMETEKKTRHQIGREAFVEAVWRWKESYGSSIINQMNCLGLSCDWTKQFFTMDEFHSKAVQEAFLRLYDKNLIYRAERMVNWCCYLQSTLSDIEVEWLSITKPTKITLPGRKRAIEFGKLDIFRYPLENAATDDSSTNSIEVATTRLETMLGDTAIAVHPHDPRYSHLINQRVKHPFRHNCYLPIVGDNAVNPEFGTGAVKLTPAHSDIDYQIAMRHSLEKVNILDPFGHLINVPEPYTGMDRYEARDKLRDHLKQLGLYVDRRSSDKPMNLPLCSRTGDVVETVLRDQWFVRSQQMAHAAIQAVKENRITFSPSSQQAVWEEWLNNCQDWCISRQLWWGHSIPAFYRPSSLTNGQREWKVPRNHRERSELLHDGWKQDEDVLDTWFSSALLPLSTAGWPNQDPSYFARHYPTNVLETGHDILFFWVARMVMLGLELTGEVPFKEVVLHGMICDSQGKKMSKSRGNVVDPMSIIRGSGSLPVAQVGQLQTLGADALRMCLSSYLRTGQMIKFHQEDVLDSRKFINKMWQTCRFIATRCDTEMRRIPWSKRLDTITQDSQNLQLSDWWILTRLCELVQQVNECLKDRAFHTPSVVCRQFWWGELCDVYLEVVKSRNDECQMQLGVNCLLLCVEILLHLLHPIMPFSTDCLWRDFFLRGGSLFNETFPLKSHFNSLLSSKTSLPVDDDVPLSTTVDQALRIVSAANEWRLMLKVPTKSLPSCSQLTYETAELSNSRDSTLVSLLHEFIPVLCKVPFFCGTPVLVQCLPSATVLIPLDTDGRINLRINRKICQVDEALKFLSKKEDSLLTRMADFRKRLESAEKGHPYDPQLSPRILQDRISQIHEALQELGQQRSMLKKGCEESLKPAIS